MKISIWKALAFFGLVTAWAEKALQPDEDGTVRLTIEELAVLADGMCKTFGWQAEIILPEEMSNK